MHGRVCCYKNVPSMVKEKQENVPSNLKGNSIDCRLCSNKFCLAFMKYYLHKKMLHKALQWKKASKFGFVCADCLPLIENDLSAQKESAFNKNGKYASSFVAGLSNNDKIQSLRNCALAKDSKILCAQVLQTMLLTVIHHQT